MSSLPERALFFAAGLVFGVLVGVLLARNPEAPPPAQPASPAPAAEIAPPVTPAEVEQQLQSLLAAVEANPEDPAARAAVGDLHLETGEFQEALYWLQQARNLAPDDPDIRSRLAFARLALGDPATAIADYEEILAGNPEHLGSLIALGRIRLFLEQDMEAGMALWERAVAAAPDSEEAALLRTQLEALRSAHPPN